MLPGHHAMSGTEKAFLPHNVTGQWRRFWINGQRVGELGIEACYAGHWDVPVCFVQGDTAACEEAREIFPWVVTSSVKWWSGSPDVCEGPSPELAHKITAEDDVRLAWARRRGCRRGRRAILRHDGFHRSCRQGFQDLASMRHFCGPLGKLNEGYGSKVQTIPDAGSSEVASRQRIVL